MTNLESGRAEALSGVADGVGSALGVAAEVLPLRLSRQWGAGGAPLERVADESEPALDIIMMNYLLKFSNMGFGCTVVEQLIYVCHRFSSTKSGLLSLDLLGHVFLLQAFSLVLLTASVTVFLWLDHYLAGTKIQEKVSISKMGQK